MTTASAPVSGAKKAQVHVQRFGTFLSGMIMPNIPALIAWGIITAFFIAAGSRRTRTLATIVGPMIHYLLPLLIAYTGGTWCTASAAAWSRSIGDDGRDRRVGLHHRGVQRDRPRRQRRSHQLGQVHMFIGAMIMGPLAAYTMKWLDKLWDGKIKAGLRDAREHVLGRHLGLRHGDRRLLPDRHLS